MALGARAGLSIRIRIQLRRTGVELSIWIWVQRVIELSVVIRIRVRFSVVAIGTLVAVYWGWMMFKVSIITATALPVFRQHCWSSIIFWFLTALEIFPQ